MALRSGHLIVVAIISTICSLGYAAHSEAKIANLHSYCSSHPNTASAGEDAVDIPRRAPVARPATWRCSEGKVWLC